MNMLTLTFAPCITLVSHCSDLYTCTSGLTANYCYAAFIQFRIVVWLSQSETLLCCNSTGTHLFDSFLHRVQFSFGRRVLWLNPQHRFQVLFTGRTVAQHLVIITPHNTYHVSRMVVRAGGGGGCGRQVVIASDSSARVEVFAVIGQLHGHVP